MLHIERGWVGGAGLACPSAPAALAALHAEHPPSNNKLSAALSGFPHASPTNPSCQARSRVGEGGVEE